MHSYRNSGLVVLVSSPSQDRMRLFVFERALDYCQFADARQVLLYETSIRLDRKAGQDAMFIQDMQITKSAKKGGLSKELFTETGIRCNIKELEKGWMPPTSSSKTVSGLLLREMRRCALFFRQGANPRDLTPGGLERTASDYAAVFSLIKEALEERLKGDLSVADVYACDQFLRACDLWDHFYVLHTTKPPTNEAQRKAIRAWVITILTQYAEKVLASKDPFSGCASLGWLRGTSGSFEEWTFNTDGWRKDWLVWYAEEPEEVLRFESISGQILKLLTDRRKQVDQKAAAARAVREAAKEAEQRRKEDPTLRK